MPFENIIKRSSIQSTTVTPDLGSDAFASGDTLIVPTYVAQTEPGVPYNVEHVRVVWNIASPPDFTLVFLSGESAPTFGVVNTAPTVTAETMSDNLLGIMSVTDSDYKQFGSSVTVSNWYGLITGASPGENSGDEPQYIFMAGVIDDAHVAFSADDLRITVQVRADSPSVY